VKVTVHHRGTIESFTIEPQGLELGGNPGTDGVAKNRLGQWSGTFSLDERGIAFNMRAGSRPATTLNGEQLDGGRLVIVKLGDVIVAGALTITVGYIATALPPSEPLATAERDLLARIAAAPDDDDARRVLADFWQQYGDEARGTLIHAGYAGQLDTCDALVREHAEAWLAPLLIAGFDRTQLDFERGFVAPIVYAPGEELARSSAALRLAPVHYRLQRMVDRDATELYEATRVTASGVIGTVAIKLPSANVREAPAIVLREIQTLRRFDSPNLPRIVDVAISRDGTALVMPWAGTSLQAILAVTRRERRAPGEAVALAIGIQLCRAYAAVHAAQVVHTELRPSHVLVDAAGQVTACGFGNASSDLRRQPRIERGSPRTRDVYRYLSPEQVLGRTLDASCDVFALAVLIGTLVTGANVIDADTDFGLLEAIRDVSHRVPTTTSRLGAKLRALLVREQEPRSSAAVLGLELARIAEDARLCTDPGVIVEWMQDLPL
jgi:uncharacterized protein (TIGR02996 family)